LFHDHFGPLGPTILGMPTQKGHTNRHKRQQKAKLLAIFIATPDEILQKGLKISGFDHWRQQRVKRETCLRWFRALYGLKQSSHITKCYSSSWLVNISPISSFTVHLLIPITKAHHHFHSL
jgi:hypothetical protein